MNEMLKRALEAGSNGYALPGVLYHDPQLYEEEIREIFLKSWLYVGHQSQIPERGDYFLFEMAGESVILVRDARRRDQCAAERLPASRLAHLRCGGGTRGALHLPLPRLDLRARRLAARRKPHAGGIRPLALRPASRARARVRRADLHQFRRGPGAVRPDRETISPRRWRPTGWIAPRSRTGRTIRSPATGSSRSRTTASAITARRRIRNIPSAMGARSRRRSMRSLLAQGDGERRAVGPHAARRSCAPGSTRACWAPSAASNAIRCCAATRPAAATARRRAAARHASRPTTAAPPTCTSGR